MGLFRKKNGLQNNKKTINKVLTEYIEGCLKMDKSIDWIRTSLENNKEFGNYTTKDIETAFDSLKKVEKPVKKHNFFSRNKTTDIEKEIKKLPRKERKKATELWKQYQEGKILKIEAN